MVRVKKRKRQVECQACSEAGGANRPIFHDPPACEYIKEVPKVTEVAKVGFIRAVTYQPIAGGNCPLCGAQWRKLRFIHFPLEDDRLGCLSCGEKIDEEHQPPFDV